MKKYNIPEVVDKAFVADLFNVSERTVDNWIKAGFIKKMNLGGTVRFSRYELERILQGDEKSA